MKLESTPKIQLIIEKVISISWCSVLIFFLLFGITIIAVRKKYQIINLDHDSIFSSGEIIGAKRINMKETMAESDADMDIEFWL